MTERELADQAQRGDAAALEQLVRPWQERAFRTAWIITRDASDAEDATQLALEKAYRHLDRFRAGEPFRPWLLRIVANEAKNIVRSRTRRRTDPFNDDGMPEPVASGADLLRDIEALERSAWLVAHINALAEPDRIAIYGRYALDLSEEELSSVLDCPRGTVKSRLHRALGRLRERIAAERKEDRP